jgi:hypothetical protein
VFRIYIVFKDPFLLFYTCSENLYVVLSSVSTIKKSVLYRYLKKIAKTTITEESI